MVTCICNHRLLQWDKWAGTEKTLRLGSLGHALQQKQQSRFWVNVWKQRTESTKLCSDLCICALAPHLPPVRYIVYIYIEITIDENWLKNKGLNEWDKLDWLELQSEWLALPRETRFPLPLLPCRTTAAFPMYVGKDNTEELQVFWAQTRGEMLSSCGGKRKRAWAQKHHRSHCAPGPLGQESRFLTS